MPGGCAADAHEVSDYTDIMPNAAKTSRVHRAPGKPAPRHVLGLKISSPWSLRTVRGVQILELAQNAQKLFARQEPREKRRLLNFVLSNCTWEDGEVVAAFRQPFDLLAETAAIAMRSEADNKGDSAKSEIWLGGQDSKLCIPK